MSLDAHVEAQEPAVAFDKGIDEAQPVCAHVPCQRPYRPGGRGPQKKRFCSQRCANAAWVAAHPRQAPRQLALPAEPPVNLVQRIGPTPAQIRAAMKPQSVKVLRMLQAAGVMGCTTGDFLRAGIGRFSARVMELRQVGHVITTDKLTDSSALFVLEGP